MGKGGLPSPTRTLRQWRLLSTWRIRGVSRRGRDLSTWTNPRLKARVDHVVPSSFSRRTSPSSFFFFFFFFFFFKKKKKKKKKKNKIKKIIKNEEKIKIFTLKLYKKIVGLR